MLTKQEKCPLHCEAGIFDMQINVPKKQLFSRFLLLPALGNSHSHSDGGADHGVVAHRKMLIFAVIIAQKHCISKKYASKNQQISFLLIPIIFPFYIQFSATVGRMLTTRRFI